MTCAALLFKPATRRPAAFSLAFALACAALALAWPARVSRAAAPATRLDGLVAEWQFGERHELLVAAPPARVMAAVRTVTAREITLFETLTAIRRLGRGVGESILNPDLDRPILDVALSSGFTARGEEPGKELVVGTRIGPRVDALMSFLLVPEGRGTRLVTETRVACETPRAARAFALYWRAILPGSDLIRRSWLRAIRRRAERAS